MRKFAQGVLTFWMILCVVLALKGSSLVLQTASWSPTADLSAARAGASAALLPDGRILITGGDSGSGPLASADIFNTDGTLSAALPMAYPRSQHVSVPSKDGRILVAGGLATGGTATNSAEIFDPTANSWTSVSFGMTEARSGATAVLLQDGRVLIAGGQNGTAISSTIEIFDPATGSFSAAGIMSSQRTKHAMTVLQDGRVLIAGGFDGSVALGSTDIFDPVAGTVSPGPNLATARFGHSATTLLNGQVAVIGGNNGNANVSQMDVTPVELFDPSAATTAFTTPAVNLATPREGHLAILLPNNNNVLIVGGTSAGTATASAELFSSQVSSTGAWSYSFPTTASLATARSNAAGSANQVNAPSSVMRRNGVVIVAGGSGATGTALNSTEGYGYATVQADQSDYPPGSTVMITGSGWKPGETVTIQLVESPLIDTHGPFTVTADANGNISNNSFVTDTHDLDVKFYLTATGSQSGFQAQNTFTDANPKLTVTMAGAGSGTVTSSDSNINCSWNGTTQSGTCSHTYSANFSGVVLTASAGGGSAFSGWSGTGGCTGILTCTAMANGSNTFAATATFAGQVSANTSTIVANPTSVVGNGTTTSTIAVTLKDSGGTTEPGKTVTLTAGSGSSTITTVNGTTNARGQAIFTVKDNTVESVTYTAKDTTDDATVSQTAAVTFTVGPVSAGASTVSANPGSVTADGTSASTITVTLFDAFSHPVSGKTVTLSQGSGSSTISPASATTNASGGVMFTVKETKAQSVTYAATDTTDSVTVTQTATVTFTAGAPAKFGFAQQPTNAQAGAAISPAPTVQIVDANGNLVTSSSASITIAIGTNPGGGALSGTLTQTASSGVATFGGLSINKAGNGYTLAASSSGLTGATSSAFNVSAAPTTTSVTSSSVGNTSTYGDSVTFTATVTNSNNSSPAFEGCVTFADDSNGGATLSGPTAVNGSGQVTFTTSTLAVGSHNVQGNYNDSSAGGCGNFGASFNNSHGNVTQTVNQKSVTPSITAQNKVYDGTTTATLSSCTVSPVVGSDDVACSVPSGNGNFSNKNVGTGKTVTATGITLTGTTAANYTLSTATATTTANITTRPIAVTAATNTKVYDGTTSATATPTITGGSLATGDTANFTETYASKNVGTNLTLTPAGSVSDGNSGNNYAVTIANNTTGVITTAALTLTAVTNTKTYDETTSAAATPAVAGLVGGDTATGLAEVYTDPSAGTGKTLTVSAYAISDGNSGNNYTVSKVDNSTGVINRANATIALTPYSVTYDGSSHTATGLAKGVLNESLSGLDLSHTTHTNAGTYSSDYWTFTDTTGNYNNVAATTITDTINKATPTVNVSFVASPITYDGNAHPATASATGVSGAVVSGTATISYTPGGASAPVKAGSYTASAQFTSSDSNYTDAASSTPASLTINQASSTTIVSCPASVTYNTMAQTPCTASATSAGGLSQPLTVSYTNNTNSGTATASASFTSDANHTGSSGSANFTILQATPTVSFAGAPALATFGAQFTVIATTNSTASATIIASGSCTISGTTVTITSGAATCSLHASWPADNNYLAAAADQSTIAQPAPVAITVPNPTVTYDGSPKVVTPTVSPAVAVVVTYTGIAPNVYAASASAPIGPGTYMVSATVADAVDYAGSGSGTLTISKKDPALVFALRTGMASQTPYGTRVYFDLTTTNSPCPIGLVQFFIDSNSQPDSTATLTGTECTQPVSAEFSTATLTPGPHTVYVTYAGDTYYLNATSAQVSYTVVADATMVTLATSAGTVYVGDSVTFTATVTPSTAIDGSANAPAGTVQFFDGGAQLGTSALTGNTATFGTSSLPAGSHSITATYVSADGNFTGSSSPVSVETVDKITPTITWPTPASIVYGTQLGNTQLNAAAADTHRGGIAVDGTFAYNPQAGTVLAVGPFNLAVTFTPTDGNTYASQTASVTITVNPATLTVTADPASRSYGVDNPPFTFQYSGFVNNETSAVVTTPPICTSTANASSPVGTYDVTCSGGVSPNYTFKYVKGILTVNPAALTITAKDATKTYGQTLTFAGTEFTTSTLYNGDTVTSVTLSSAGAQATAVTGTYGITPSAAIGTGLSNYNTTYANGKLTVNPAALTITAKDASKSYGQTLTLAGTEFTSSGLVNSDTVSSVTFTSAGTPATAAAGSYGITPSAAVGTGLTNYTITYKNGTLTVSKAHLTVTADDKGKTYDGAVFSPFTATISGFVNGETLATSGVTGSAAFTGAATTAVNAGSFAITPTMGTLAATNYDFPAANFVNGTLTINKAHLTVTADNKVKTYDGTAFSALTATLSGFVNNETDAALRASGALSGSAGFTGAAISAVNAGSYTVTPTAGTLATTNYDFPVFNNGTLTINRRDAIWTTNSNSKTYAAPDPNPLTTGSGTNFVAADNVTATYIRVAGETVLAGPYHITAALAPTAVLSNYNITNAGASFTINPAPLTITAGSPTVNYGTAVPAIVASYSGFVNGDTPASLTTAPSCSTAAHGPPSGSPVGGYSSTCFGAVDGNYIISYTPGTVSIVAVPLSITASSPMVSYGTAVPAITPSYSGFVNGDTPSSLTTAPSCSTAAHGPPSGSSVGSYPSTCSGAVDGNYIVSYTPGTVSIVAVPLTTTASSGSFTYGGAVPTITPVYTGFVNGDSSANLTTPPACSTTATSGSPVSGSPYPSTCSGAVDANYIIGYVSGSVTETPAPLTITASSGSMIYGGPVFPVTPAYSGFVNGDGAGSLTSQPKCGTTATSAIPVGAYASSCSGAADTNYMITYVPSVVTINQASSTTSVGSLVNPSTYMQLVTFTATVAPQYAGTLPTGTVTFYNNGSQIGTGVLSVSACGTPPCPVQATFSTTSLPDSGTDTITAAYGGDTNFLASTSPSLAQTVEPAPVVNLNPLFVSFGNQNVNTTSKAATVTLTNIGDAALTIPSGGISITGANPGDFSQTNNCGSSVAATKSCVINVTFAPTATSVRMATLQISDNDDDATNAQQFVSLTGAGLSTITGASLYTDAIFAEANGCGSITMSGGSSVDSFNSSLGYAGSHQNSGGNVRTNGNVTVNGSKSAIYGSAAASSATTGNCSKTTMTGLTTSGGAQVTGGLAQLNAPVTYPVPPAPSPVPPTTTQNISGSCGSLSGCSNTGTGSKPITLAPGQYGNLAISGGTTAHFSKGTYNVNSLTLSGQSVLYVDSGPVVINLAGASMSGANPVLDLTGGSIQNPSGNPANLQFVYAGSRGVNLSGGSASYASVYAPLALVNLSGGTDFFGSIIGGTVTSSGGTAIHYDANLPNIQGGNYLWFTAVVNNVAGLPNNNQVKLYLTNSSIQYTANGTNYNVPVPNAVVTFDSVVQASGASTSYDVTNSRWSTLVSSKGLTGNTFVTGVAVPVPAGGFPTGLQNVSWSGAFSTDTPGITLQWQWGAAVYTMFSSTYAASSNNNVLGVNAEDGSADAYGTDPAGTPENFKQYATFGGTGGGLTNYTGYVSAGAGVVPTIAPMSVSPSSLQFAAQNQGTTSGVMSAVLTNNDSQAYTITGISIGGTNAGNFALVSGANNCGVSLSLSSGASCTLYFTFTPSDVGVRSARVYVYDGASNSPQTVYLSGTGQ